MVDAHPADGRAVLDGDRWWTWGDLRAAAAAVAGGLAALGVGEGEPVAIVWPTSADFVVAYLAVLSLGAVAAPLNPLSPVAELQSELAVLGARVVLAGGPAAAALTGPEPPGATVVVPGGSGTGPAWEHLLTATPDGGRAVSPAPAAPGWAPVARNDDDLAVLLFTSGTAGRPKAAMLTHGNLIANLHQMLSVPGEMVRPDDVGLAAVPLFHVFGLNVALGLSIATGAALVMEERFDPAESLRLVAEAGVTLVIGAPPMFASWADLEPPAPDTAGRVRRALSGAAALSAEVAERFERRWGIPLWQGYGLTEASPGVATSLGTGRHRAGSVGRPLPGVEVRLVDEAGDDVLEGDPGEIWVRGPNVFAGYWRDDAATASVLTADGWLRTGDVGVVHPDGDLYVVDRRKDLVIVSGFNVFPAEVEAALTDLAGLAEVVVVGRPDPATGEAVEAVVVREPGSTLDAEQVIAHCARRLARYKCPASVRFVEELPRGLAGKALRRALQPGGEASAGSLPS